MTGPGFVVHPPLGKWMMAVGEAMFDHGKTVTFARTTRSIPASPLSFRFMGALLGTLAILIVARIARRMFRSTALGVIAGAAVRPRRPGVRAEPYGDARHLPDVLGGRGVRLPGRRPRRRPPQARRPADRTAAASTSGDRRWASARGGGRAALCLGAACATKWDGAFYIPAFMVLAVAWDVGARRTAGSRDGLLGAEGWRSTDRSDGRPRAVVCRSSCRIRRGRLRRVVDRLVPVQRPVRLRPRPVRASRPVVVRARLVGAARLVDLPAGDLALRQHADMDNNPHPYLSRPWGWLLLARPVAYYYQTPPGLRHRRRARRRFSASATRRCGGPRSPR